MKSILIIDDDREFRETLSETVNDLGYQVVQSESVANALKEIAVKRFDAVFIDFNMPQMNGIEGIKTIRQLPGMGSIPIVMITAFVDSDRVIEAMRYGAFDHLTKPISKESVESLLASLSVESSAASPTPVVGQSTTTLVGSSPQTKSVLKLIGKVAASDSSVLVTGETGTGKELVAQSIHRFSDRAKAPLIAINCAAIPETLLESELFGHSKGAFTGATSDKVGAFQRADGGTVFLDEIGDMDLQLQAKLLRVLQEREVTPVGSTRSVKIDARFIAATHQNLRELVVQGLFREDLLYRLDVVEISLPPLRERSGDVAELASLFLKQNSTGTAHHALSVAAMAKLEGYSWPGNVRELKNVIERAVVTARRELIEADEIALREAVRPSESIDFKGLPLSAAVKTVEKELIYRALQDSNFNRSEAARKLGIGRQLLYTKMREYDLTKI